MCGIAAISLAAGDNHLNTKTVSAALLRGIESRGRQATGAAWYNEGTHAVQVTKLPVTAETFLQHRDEHLPQAAPVMILHTRYGTHGDGSDRNNLHPVIHNRIIGVHNGVLQNHPDLFKLADSKPTSKVDTEGMMALLNIEEHPTQLLGKIRGDAALAWLDLEDPTVLHMANVTGRPLVIAQTQQGSLIAASTASAINRAAFAGKLNIVYTEEVKEETYLKVIQGVIVESSHIKGVQASSKAFKQQHAWTSGTTGATGAASKRTGTGARGGTRKPAARQPVVADAVFQEPAQSERLPIKVTT